MEKNIVSVIYDEYNDLLQQVEYERNTRQNEINNQRITNCNNCEIDWKNSKSPKDDYTLWVKTGRKSGVIKMINGDEYNFDYEKGKCKVTNGWFKSDDYYDTFDKMIIDLLKKCKLKYCN